MRGAADAADFSAQFLLQSIVIVKAARTGGEVTCHQDSTFLLYGAGKLLRLLGRARRRDDENGCMAFLPGEHKGALRRIFRRTGESAENAQTFGFRDSDRDGYPDARACNWDAHNLRWICGSDCDDNRRETNPNQAEVCNSIDDNCDGAIDSGVTSAYFRDADLDGFGDANARIDQCFPPPGSSINANDCNDAVETTHPGQFEIANGVDDNCNGAIDEAPLVGIIR